MRKATARTGDPQLHALVHLAFGRLEAKVGHLAIAQRHIRLARLALELDPNLQLQAAVDLDEAAVLWLTGDIRGAIDLAERGTVGASESGWARGCATASANLAWLYVCAGRIAEARTHLQTSLEESVLSPSLRLAFADTEARVRMAEGDFSSVVSTLVTRAADHTIESWYRLAAEQTHVQALLRMGRHVEALDRATKAIAFAQGPSWTRSLRHSSLRVRLPLLSSEKCQRQRISYSAGK